MQVIVITGTPGTGKTTLAKAIASKVKGSCLIRANEVVAERGLFSSYSHDGTMVVRMQDLRKELEKRIKACSGTAILEGHLLCDIGIDGATAIVVREHLERLRKRMVKRRYATEKIRDNIVAEAIDYCGENARKNYKKVFEIMGGNGSLDAALKILKGGKGRGKTIELLSELKGIMKRHRKLVIS